MKYLKDVRTLEDLKKEYRTWALKLHPDRGGSTEEMQVLNAEYEYLFERVKDIHMNKQGETYKKHTEEKPYEFMDLLDRLLRMDGVHIEIIGFFVWLSGNTKEHKTEIKSLGFKWHSDKQMWYLAPEWYVKYSRKKYTINDIRSMFGVRYEADGVGNIRIGEER